ncbi:MAG: hypothetical protein HOO86_06595 [Bacteroidales bacterium]|nr:hypothetical protein [Bacteroidales bacterium]
MKKIIICAVMALQFFVIQGYAQDVTGKLEQAKASYSSGDLENTRFALQQALQEINQIIAKEILGMLPVEIGKMPTIVAEDSYSGGSGGFAGLTVHRNYKSVTGSLSLDIIGDSPMIKTINMVISMPGFMSGDPNQKKVKIAGYKALLTKNTDEKGVVSFTVQLPFDTSLLSVNSDGIADENELIAALNTIPMADIAAKAK